MSIAEQRHKGGPWDHVATFARTLRVPCLLLLCLFLPSGCKQPPSSTPAPPPVITFMVARRRKHHREPVVILASVSSHTQPFGEATLVNLSEGGAKLRTSQQDFVTGVSLTAGEDVNLRFALPGEAAMLDVTATVVWTTTDSCGVRFRFIPDTQRAALQQWLTACVERSVSRICERIREACA